MTQVCFETMKKFVEKGSSPLATALGGQVPGLNYQVPFGNSAPHGGLRVSWHVILRLSGYMTRR